MRRSEIPRDIFFGDDDESNDEASDGTTPEPDDSDEPNNGTDRAEEPVDASGEDATNGQKTQKMQVSVYLTKPTARKLDAVRFELQYDHDVKLSKSDLAEFAISRLDRNIAEIIDAARNGAFDW